ncbi:uncharacterized protein B0H18DRAFT_339457 [Fomitopsis serialis]|uniref:uncharacterized protein n=1 Tax=Fomitopsis serialis TaxID=139415 RepID=UPI0020075FB0|nr:uncharacterized protein B0H18DRAFT_339457 [Neoantrodia serialis]KAH9926377.1 hypothetical protein B0H18DRAFT_339457 [Neoantrodia serialis]
MDALVGLSAGLPCPTSAGSGVQPPCSALASGPISQPLQPSNGLPRFCNDPVRSRSTSTWISATRSPASRCFPATSYPYPAFAPQPAAQRAHSRANERLAPLLEKISISRARSSSQSDDDCAYLSALLCRERTPRLTKLSISDVGLHLLGPCSQSLKHLFVDLSQSVNRSYARTFLDAVREMPSLETITYQRHLVAPILNAPLPPSRTIQLPHLKSMRMATEAWECLTLLREMALPGLAELNVSSTVTVIYGPLLVDAIAQNIPNIAELATLNVSRYPTYVRVATGPKDMLFPSDGLRFSLDVSMRYCLANDSDRIISSLTLLQPLRGARHLVVDGACMSESSWSAIFEGMDDVTRLSVSGSEAAEKLPLALARRRHTLDTVRQSLEPQEHLPSLRSLELTRVHFGDKETLRVGTLSGFAADFRASLAIRARHGRKLDELRIVRGSTCTREWSMPSAML